MPFHGHAFLAIWTDIQGVDPGEYEAWFVHEHLGERVDVPGFIRGLRYEAVDGAAQRYFMLYDVDGLEVLTGPAYLARLNNPSSWTVQMMPHMDNFLRAGCRVVTSKGRHVGGTIATIIMEAQLETTASSSFCEEVLAYRHVVGVHLGQADPKVSSISTSEKQLRRRGGAEGDVHQVCLIESANQSELVRTLPELIQILEKHYRPSSVSTATYSLSCLMP